MISKKEMLGWLVVGMTIIGLLIWMAESTPSSNSVPITPTPLPEKFENNPQSTSFALPLGIGAVFVIGGAGWAWRRKARRRKALYPRTSTILKKVAEIEAGKALSTDRGKWDHDDWRFMALDLEQYYKAALRKISNLQSTLSEKERKLSQAAKTPESNVEELHAVLDEQEEALFQKSQEARTLAQRLEEAASKLVAFSRAHDELTLKLEQREQALAALQEQAENRQVLVAAGSRTWRELVERLNQFHRKRKPSQRATRDLVRWLGGVIPNKDKDAFKASVLAISSPPPSKAP